MACNSVQKYIIPGIVFLNNRSSTLDQRNTPKLHTFRAVDRKISPLLSCIKYAWNGIPPQKKANYSMTTATITSATAEDGAIITPADDPSPDPSSLTGPASITGSI